VRLGVLFAEPLLSRAEPFVDVVHARYFSLVMEANSTLAVARDGAR
jgi:hypothetical protein